MQKLQKSDEEQRIEIAWASKIISSNEGFALVPTNREYTKFTQAVSDNGDYCQEFNAFHIINTIPYYYGTNGSFTLPSVLQKLPRRDPRRRPFKLPPLEIKEKAAENAKSGLPEYYSDADIKSFLFQDLCVKKKFMRFFNLSWATAKNIPQKYLVKEKPQAVPEWSTYHSII